MFEYNLEEVNLVTIPSKQVYTYMTVKDTIVQKVQNSYVYDVDILLRDIE